MMINAVNSVDDGCCFVVVIAYSAGRSVSRCRHRRRLRLWIHRSASIGHPRHALLPTTQSHQ